MISLAMNEGGPVENPRFTLLGLGNILLGDEGVGVRVIQQIQSQFEETPEMEIVDGGTSGIELLPHLRKDGVLVIVDAVAPHDAAGKIIRLEDEEVPSFLDAKLSPHQIGLPDLLATASLLDQTPRKVIFIGIEPYTVETGVELSPLMREKLPLLQEMALKELERAGAALQKKQS